MGWTGTRRLLRALACLLPLGSSVAALADEPGAVVLTILHTNDTHGHVLSGTNLSDETHGGLARAATVARQVRQTMPNVLLFDTGDWAHGTPEEYLSAGAASASVLRAVGYDAICPGNHEFGWGADAARTDLMAVGCPVVCANLLDATTGQPWDPVRPWVIFTKSSVRVAVFGLTTLETVSLEWPSFLAGIKFEDPFAAAARLVPELRRQADVVVLLSHLGLAQDLLLAAAVPGIDLILGGHSHSNVTTRLTAGGAVIAQTGAYAERIGRVDLLLRPTTNGNGYLIADVNGKDGRWWGSGPEAPLGATYPTSPSIELDGSYAPDPTVVSAYAIYRDEARWRQEQVLATADAAITDEGAPGDTPLSRLVADQIRAATGADVALVDGKMRGTIGPGKVTAGQAWAALGGYTAQNVVKLRATGTALRQALEQWAGSPAGLAIGVSGLWASYNPAKQLGKRVQDVRVAGQPPDPDPARWEPLEPNREYTVAAVAYVARRFPSLMACRVESNQLGWTRELLAKGLRAAGRIAPDMRSRLVRTRG